MEAKQYLLPEIVPATGEACQLLALFTRLAGGKLDSPEQIHEQPRRVRFHVADPTEGEPEGSVKGLRLHHIIGTAPIMSQEASCPTEEVSAPATPTALPPRLESAQEHPQRGSGSASQGPSRSLPRLPVVEKSTERQCPASQTGLGFEALPGRVSSSASQWVESHQPGTKETTKGSLAEQEKEAEQEEGKFVDIEKFVCYLNSRRSKDYLNFDFNKEREWVIEHRSVIEAPLAHTIRNGSWAEPTRFHYRLVCQVHCLHGHCMYDLQSYGEWDCDVCARTIQVFLCEDEEEQFACCQQCDWKVCGQCRRLLVKLAIAYRRNYYRFVSSAEPRT